MRFIGGFVPLFVLLVANSPPCSYAASVDTTEPNGTFKASWRFKYFDEQASDSRWLVRENSVDERLANLIYVLNSVSGAIISTGLQSGQPKLDLELEEAAGGSAVDNELCGEQLEQMISLMEDLDRRLQSQRQQQNSSGRIDLKESHFKLAHVLDSFGRYESGALAGRFLFLGSYTQCVGSSLILGQNTQVNLRQCLARLTLEPKLDRELVGLKRKWMFPDNQLSAAICLPKSCHSKSFKKHGKLLTKLASSQFKLPQSIYLDEHLKLNSIYCPVDESSQLIKISLFGWLLLAFLLIWLFLTIYATLTAKGTLANNKQISWRDHLRKSLDLKASLQDFIGDSGSRLEVATSRRVDLDTINPVKVIGCFYVAFGHALMISLNSSQNQLKAQQELENDPWMFLAMSGTVIVDGFFIITGLMIGYLGTRRLIKDEPIGFYQLAKKCVQFAAARYLRLAPLYAIIYYFKRLILNNLSSGPRWDHGLDHRTLTGACKQESWLTPFTFMAAYQPLSRSCIPQAWSVAADMFFGVALAPVVVLMSKRPKLVIPIVSGVCLASAWSMLQDYRSLDPELRIQLTNMRLHSFAQLFNEYTEMYSVPHNRIFAAIIGSVAGYFLARYGEFNEPKEWPQWFKGPVTKVSIYLMINICLMPVGVPLFRDNLLKVYPIHHYMFDHSMTTGRLVWCLAATVVLVRMMTDWKDSFLMQISTGSFWRSMVRLNYLILLLHMDLELIDAYLQTSIVYFSWYRSWTMFANSYLASLLLAIPLHIILENPIDKVIKGFMQGYSNNKPAKEESTVTREMKKFVKG